MQIFRIALSEGFIPKWQTRITFVLGINKNRLGPLGEIMNNYPLDILFKSALDVNWVLSVTKINHIAAILINRCGVMLP